jgi:Uma2 family endonuclease
MVMPNLQRRWTVADRDALPDDGNRYEVIDGELFVTPAPVWRHQEAVIELATRLRAYLARERVGHAYIAPADVVFSPKRGVQPDVFVVPLLDGRRPEHFDEVRRLLLAVEVLSPSTARADRVVKRKLFREEGVAEYWIVDADSRTVERATPREPRLEIVDERLEWLPNGASTPFVLDLPEYFAKVLDG